MKITIIAPGSRGDVQPNVALGKGLKDAGHIVRFLAGSDFRELVSAYGLEFFDLGSSMQSAAQGMQDLLEKGNFLKILASMGQTAKNLVMQASQSGLEACTGSDLILAGIGGLFVGLALSEKLGISLIQAHYYPFTPTSEFPNALVPLPPVHLPGWANRLTHQAAQQMLWQNYRSADTLARRKILQLKPTGFWGPFSALQQGQAVLYGYSAHVIPFPKDWDDFIHVTGYWFLDPPSGWEPPAELINFLQAGPAPVYIGFGSMVNSRPGETTALILEALKRSGQRGVISAGWGRLENTQLPESVFMIGSVPFGWLFPQMAALVHHGGAGTTSMGLRAGVPAVITPFMGDQPFWGQRIYELGAGPKPIPRRNLTADNLAEAIHRAISDTAIREQAAHLGKLIQAEDGVGRAVEIIEKTLHR
jgi:sterol 3beta-glucosyltransferase